MKTIEDERLNWARFQAEHVRRSMRRLRANPDFARERVWVHDKLALHQKKLIVLEAEIHRIERAS
jgi:hypothetical protein